MTAREVAVRAYRETLPILAVGAAGGLFAGAVLGGMERELRAVPGLLLLVPALLATRGNVYGSLGARLASALHQGVIAPMPRLTDRRFRAALAAALANGVLVSVLAALLGYGLLVAVSRPAAPAVALVAIATLAGLISGVLLTVAVVAAVFVGYRRGIDPDAIAGPVVTTTGDLVGLATLIFAVRMVAFGGLL